MLSKIKKFYILLFVIILITPTFSLAFEEDNIFVWSNFSSIPTSKDISEQEKLDTSNR